MQNKTAISIQIICATLMIAAFFLPWVEKGFISISGFKLPTFNESLTKGFNILYTFTPSKKSYTKTAYIFYLIPILNMLAIFLIFKLKVRFSKYILLFSSSLATIFSLYLYSSLTFSYTGKGVHLLLITSIIYIALFFSPLLKNKKKADQEDTLIQPNNNLND